MENAQTISCPKCDLSVSSICSKCNKEVEVSQLADGCVVQITNVLNALIHQLLKISAWKISPLT